MLKKSILILMLAVSFAFAGTDNKTPKEIINENPLNTCEIATGYSFSVGNDSYNGIPINLTYSRYLASYDNTIKVIRGFSEIFARSYNNITINGAESRLNGGIGGLRYNFIQDGWKLIPFCEVGCGFLFADTRQNGYDEGLDKDLNLLISTSIGVTYDVSDKIFVRSFIGFDEIVNGDAIIQLTPSVSIGYIF